MKAKKFNSTIESRPNGPAEIYSRAEREGKAYLALLVRGIPSRCSGVRLNAMMSETGLLALPAKPDGPAYEFSEWKIERRELSEGEWVFMGPDFRGLSLSSLLAGTNSEESAAAALSALAKISRALAELKKSGGKIPFFLASSVLVADSGAILIFPPSLARGCVVHSAAPQSGFARVDADIRRSVTHFLGAAVREAVVLSDGGRPDPRAEALPLSRISPRLHPALLAADDSWRRSPESFSVEKWAKALGEAPSGFFRSSSPEKAEAERLKKAKAMTRVGRLDDMKALFKRGRPFLIAAAVLAVLAAFLVPSLLKSRAESRRFLAYSPDRIVAAYYGAYSSLSDMDMELCVKKGALKPDIRSVVNMSVILKVRMATERHDPFVPAEKWIASGKPPIYENDYLFGPTNLRIEELPGSASSPGFKASYDLYVTEPREGEGVRYVRRSVVDELGLEMTALGWKIAKLRRTEGEPIQEQVSFVE